MKELPCHAGRAVHVGDKVLTSATSVMPKAPTLVALNPPRESGGYPQQPEAKKLNILVFRGLPQPCLSLSLFFLLQKLRNPMLPPCLPPRPAQLKTHPPTPHPPP